MLACYLYILFITNKCNVNLTLWFGSSGKSHIWRETHLICIFFCFFKSLFKVCMTLGWKHSYWLWNLHTGSQASLDSAPHPTTNSSQNFPFTYIPVVILPVYSALSLPLYQWCFLFFMEAHNNCWRTVKSTVLLKVVKKACLHKNK